MCQNDFLNVFNKWFCKRFHVIDNQSLSDLEFDLQGHSRSNPMAPFESSHMTSYLSLIIPMALSGSIWKL